jgi:hypothetical protein
MPKITDYPRAPLDRAFALAEAVDKLGGEATAEMTAESMGNKIGGAFASLIGAAVKYGLIANSKGRLKTAPLFQDYKLAYNESQKKEAVRKAFLNAPLFTAIVTRLQGQTMPGHFEKLLIREHSVPEDSASRIVGYFTEGARAAGLLDSNGTIGAATVTSPSQRSAAPTQEADSDDLQDDAESGAPAPFIRGYTVRITGPGIDTKIAIKDEEDIEIVDVTLKKVRKLLKAQHQQELMGGAPS